MWNGGSSAIHPGSICCGASPGSRLRGNPGTPEMKRRVEQGKLPHLALRIQRKAHVVGIVKGLAPVHPEEIVLPGFKITQAGAELEAQLARFKADLHEAVEAVAVNPRVLLEREGRVGSHNPRRFARPPPRQRGIA